MIFTQSLLVQAAVPLLQTTARALNPFKVVRNFVDRAGKSPVSCSPVKVMDQIYPSCESGPETRSTMTWSIVGSPSSAVCISAGVASNGSGDVKDSNIRDGSICDWRFMLITKVPLRTSPS